MNRKKRRTYIVVVLLGILIVILFLGFSYFLGTQIVAGSTQLVTNETTVDVHEDLWRTYGFDCEQFEQSCIIEKLELTSSLDGHIIPADYIYAGGTCEGVVIMVHGLGGNRFTNYPIAKFFLEKGYYVITYDQRSSGENRAEKTTFGYWEKYDLMDCIACAKELLPGKKIGVWGESFGGATAVQAVAYEGIQQDIVFLILDCPVSSMEWMVEEEMRTMDMGIPLEYMMWCGNIANRMELGFSYEDTDCTVIAKEIHIPTLIINSEIDTTTPYFMGKDIYDNLASEKKELWTVTDSEHVEMWLNHNEEYRSKVLDYLQD